MAICMSILYLVKGVFRLLAARLYKRQWDLDYCRIGDAFCWLNEAPRMATNGSCLNHGWLGGIGRRLTLESCGELFSTIYLTDTLKYSLPVFGGYIFNQSLESPISFYSPLILPFLYRFLKGWTNGLPNFGYKRETRRVCMSSDSSKNTTDSSLTGANCLPCFLHCAINCWHGTAAWHRWYCCLLCNRVLYAFYFVDSLACMHAILMCKGGSSNLQ